MKNSSNDIINELKALSPLLASMDKVNVYTVPNGYFNTIAVTVLSGLQNNENNNATIIKATGIDVPANYFDNLATNIIAKIKAEQLTVAEELEQLSTFLYSIKQKNKQPVFNVPVDYFNNLSVNIIAKIKGAQHTSADEIRELSPMLYSIQNENVFTIPAGYFNLLAENILLKIQPILAPIVPMQKRNQFFKYAIAASIIVIMTLGLFTFEKNNSGVNANSIITASLIQPSILNGKSMDDAQYNNTLNNLSSDEIATYLERRTDEGDVPTLTENLNANSIPSQDDYIVDDKTLDNYLQEINSTTKN